MFGVLPRYAEVVEMQRTEGEDQIACSDAAESSQTAHHLSLQDGAVQIDLEFVWSIVVEDLPVLKEKAERLRDYLASLPEQQ